VSAGGADFEVVAGRVWHRPAEIYDEAGADIGLRITNRGDKELTFNLTDTLKVGLKSADGKELVQAVVHKSFLSDKPVRVAAGKSETVTLPPSYFTRASPQCVLDSTVVLVGIGSPMTSSPASTPEPPLRNQQKDKACWLGKVQTETVEIEVKAAKR